MERGVQTLVNRILADARAEAEERIRRGRHAAEPLLERMRGEIEQERRQALQRAEDQARAQRQRILSSAELAARKEVQSYREGLIEQCFRAARERMATMTDADRRRRSLERLLVEAAEALGGGELVVWVNGEDRALLNDRALANLALGRQKPFHLSLAPEAAPILGGARLATNDGRRGFDNSWDARLERLRPGLRAEVWAILNAEEE